MCIANDVDPYVLDLGFGRSLICVFGSLAGSGNSGDETYSLTNGGALCT
jgi:hypothetical protein